MLDMDFGDREFRRFRAKKRVSDRYTNPNNGAEGNKSDNNPYATFTGTALFLTTRVAVPFHDPGIRRRWNAIDLVPWDLDNVGFFRVIRRMWWWWWRVVGGFCIGSPTPRHTQHRPQSESPQWNPKKAVRRRAKGKILDGQNPCNPCCLSGFGWDDNLRMITCSETVFDEYIAAHPEHEAFFNKKIEMYDEMALVVGKDTATGQFAKSFDDIEEETVVESDTIDFGVAEVSKRKCTASSSEAPTQARPHRKRSHDKDEGYDMLSAQIGEVALGIKKLSDDRLDVKDLYAEVMKTEGFDELTLASAFDHLVENEKVAKAFMVNSARLRREWLEGFFNMNA
ncbi:hypothetical protein Vadar_003456 [Vaccinium darrowii]|uniref:Uncharacterized protein n=1 Tax=Vaccinium darrowii TaxID=229202 RepID=A0ACB7Z207_9ERIC|nr:hypothetical protein Vadar_003456 [Vaccinium darrowii]